MNKDDLEWKVLDEQRLIAVHNMGFSVIIPQHDTDYIPLECPLCNMLLNKQKDIQAYQKCLVCHNCRMCWHEPNYEKWKNGWRPSKKQIDIERKKQLSLPSCLFK